MAAFARAASCRARTLATNRRRTDTRAMKEQSMSRIGAATRRPLAFAVALGILGGSALIATTMLSSRGPLILVPYAALVIIAGLFLRAEVVQPLSRRFSLTLGAFMIATVILYLFTAIFAAHSLTTISLAGHLWRLGVMLRSEE